MFNGYYGYRKVFCLLSITAHINHIRKTAGVNHVGLGAGYDGILRHVSSRLINSLTY